MMDKSTAFVLWFDQIGIEDVGLTGGKNASLGEMYRLLTPKGVRIPNGFAITAYAYRYLLEKARVRDEIRDVLHDLDTTDMENLQERGHKIRQIIRTAEFPPELKKAIADAYHDLCKQYGDNVDVAVRSSATAEDLPDASFAGQQETYLNIRGEDALLDACRNCFASLFTNRAISYRVDKGFDHFSIALSIGVQKMVRSDLSCSGVMFSIDTESGFRDAAFITASYGLGENIVQGAVNPDEYYVFKPTLKQGFRPIIEKSVGSKTIKMIYDLQGVKSTTKNVSVSEEDRKKFVLTDDEIIILAKWACIIEDHYSQKAGKFKPMDMEWAKDGETNELYIVQARPETVMSQKDFSVVEEYVLKERGKIVAKGHSVGEKIGRGKANVIKEVKDIANFRRGEVLVTEMTDPDWEPIMKIASAIVTNRGGRTCFAGDTKILTNYGFRTMEQLYEYYDSKEDVLVPSLNRQTMKIEWKPVLAVMKRQAPVMEIATSLTGRQQTNTLRLTPDHKMISIHQRKLVDKKVGDMLVDREHLVIAQRIPSLTSSSLREQRLAYLLGAISTDGHIHSTSRHGEVAFIQKPTPEKEAFISMVMENMAAVFGKQALIRPKKLSSGMIRGKIAAGTANSYRWFGKQMAIELEREQEQWTQTLLEADETMVWSFLAGVVDGDGSYNKAAHRINIYCSKLWLLESVVVACLRLGIVPQITSNRTIANVQIVERLEELSTYTKRVKASGRRKRVGTRFFAAKQLLKDIQSTVNKKGNIGRYVAGNLLIDAEKLALLEMSPASIEAKDDLFRLLSSDLRQQRVSFIQDKGVQDVYTMTVSDNHNYLVFSDGYTPVVVNNCHAAIISRELGIPCVVGTTNGTEAIKPGQNITVSCAEGEDGLVYDGLLKYDVEKHDLKNFPKTKTAIMVNVGSPEIAFDVSFLPNAGVGLAREEFIINSYIQIHPRALMEFSKLQDESLKQKINELTYGYQDKTKFFVDKLAMGVAKIAAAFYPKKVILRFSDFKSNEYANLIGGHLYEPKEDNPMIGWRGASRYYKEGYRAGFALECQAIKKAREEMGLTNLHVMIPMCRTIDEGKKVLKEMEKNNLKKGKNGLQVYAMCEVPANVILAEDFLDIFDGFSIGSNDLTQFTLAVDRDSELVADIYDERNEAVKTLIKAVIQICNRRGKYIGICGQAPSDYPEFAQFLVESGIQSISLNPDSVLKTTLKIAETEKKLGINPV